MRKKAKAAAARVDAAEATSAPAATPGDRSGAPKGPPVDPKDVGRHLRNLRRERGLSRAEVARSAGLTKRELAAYESGRAAVPDHDLFCLAGSCGVDVDDLLPGRDDLRVGPNGSSLTIGTEHRTPIGTSPDEILRTYAEMIKQLRVLAPGAPVPWRAEDMAALAEALGGTPASIEARLVELTGASPLEAAQMRAVLVPTAAPSNSFTIGTAASIETHDFFAAPRAADPFAPPPPLEASPAPELVHAMAGAAAPVETGVATAPPAPAVTGHADPFGFVPEAANGASIATDVLHPITPPSASVGFAVEPEVPAYWGIGGEEIFLWGDRTSSAVHAAALATAMPVADPAPVWAPEPEPEPEPQLQPVAAAPAPAPAPPAAPAPAPAPPAPPVAAPAPAPAAPAPAPAPPTASAPAPATPPPAPAPSAADEIAWQVGGTIDGPGGDPSAATRWALSDLRVPGDSVVEAVLDFASGTGFGVLFRATADDHDRMSGYSFDVDPLGGAYVVRQWVANIPHWQTLAQTPSSPTRQYGRHTMTIRLVGDAMSASVDGVSVMTIPSLSEASIATGCEPARGHRVGLQATPTADVTVESFRAMSA